MTTIINKQTPFLWSKIQKNLVILALIVAVVSCSKKDKLQTATFETPTGWGYTIASENKILIKQTIIPVISKTQSFSSKEDALKVADLVVKKLNQNISPSVTKNDLILLKIKF